MTHPRALDDETAKSLERWYAEHEFMTTVAQKCRELGINKVTFYDTVRRVRGEATRYIPKRKPAFNIQALVAMFTVEPQPLVENDRPDSQASVR